MTIRFFLFAFLMLFACGRFVVAQQPDILFADFEGDDFGPWKATGEAFGKGPAAGTLPDQMHVSGFKGNRLVNSYHNRDGTIGTLTSPTFTIDRKYIAFLIGGGGHVGKTCVNLIVDGKVVRSSTGPSEGSEQLEDDGWDVSQWLGKRATIQAVDSATGGWGHVLLDHIVFTDTRPAIQTNVQREFFADKRYLRLPVKNGARERRLTLAVPGEESKQFTIELADGDPDWWAFLDISRLAGKTLTVSVDRLRPDSKGLAAIDQGDTLRDADDLYKEPLRPQLHFSSRRGWLNDPNGLVFHDGEYHLFYQHNPYGIRWGNMHWGHAVSRDLLHWEERPIALYPDKMGPMFSGSGVVDWNNTSGFGKGGKPPLVLAYTAFGSPPVQCLAYSNDSGKTWTKFAGNPVVENISPQDRDPKIIWHEPTKRWVMVLYVEVRKDGAKGNEHAIQFFTSPDLKEWTYRSQVRGLYECPDLFVLALDGDAKKTKWVLTAASSEYMVGDFDGETFTPETKKLPGHRGRGFYAAQTFSDIADGRRIQIGWGQMNSPGMPFNQMMCFPCELSLRTTKEGPRLAWLPVKEIEKLRVKSRRFDKKDLKNGAEKLLGDIKAELMEVRIEAEVDDRAEITLKIRGIDVRFDAAKNELRVGDHAVQLPSLDGRLNLIALVDRTSLTLWAADGLAYVPFPVIPAAGNQSVELKVSPRGAVATNLEVHELQSIWPAGRK
jgi:fructan beta-fructosidase